MQAHTLSEIIPTTSQATCQHQHSGAIRSSIIDMAHASIDQETKHFQLSMAARPVHRATAIFPTKLKTFLTFLTQCVDGRMAHVVADSPSSLCEKFGFLRSLNNSSCFLIIALMWSLWGVRWSVTNYITTVKPFMFHAVKNMRASSQRNFHVNLEAQLLRCNSVLLDYD